MTNQVRLTLEFLEDGKPVEKRGNLLEYQHENTAATLEHIVGTTIREFNPWDGRSKK